MSLTEITFWCVFLGGTIGALFRPTYGVLLYILVYTLNPEAQWWGQTVRVLELRTSLIVASAIAIGMVLNWRGMRKTESQFPPMFLLSLLFLAYCFAVSITAMQPMGSHVSRLRIDKLMRILIFIFMLIRVVQSSADFRAVIWAWMAGTIYIGYQAWAGVGGNISGRLSSGLGGADFDQSSGLAAHMVPMVAFAGFLFYSSRKWSAKLLALLAAAFAINTIILTRTRNAFPGILILIFFGLLRLPRGVRLKCAMGIFVGLACAIQLTDDGWWERMATLRHPDKDEAISRRYDYWRAAFEMASDYPWGVGVGHFRDLVPEYVADLNIGRSAHSTYFQCLAELGYPGLLLYLCIVAATLYQLERARAVGRHWRGWVESHPELAEEQRELHLLATANEVAICGFLVCAAFTSRLWVEGLWVMMAMSCCLHNIAGNLRQRLREVPKPGRDALPATPALLARTSGYY